MHILCLTDKGVEMHGFSARMQRSAGAIKRERIMHPENDGAEKAASWLEHGMIASALVSSIASSRFPCHLRSIDSTAHRDGVTFQELDRRILLHYEVHFRLTRSLSTEFIFHCKAATTTTTIWLSFSPTSEVKCS